MALGFVPKQSPKSALGGGFVRRRSFFWPAGQAGGRSGPRLGAQVTQAAASTWDGAAAYATFKLGGPAEAGAILSGLAPQPSLGPSENPFRRAAPRRREKIENGRRDSCLQIRPMLTLPHRAGQKKRQNAAAGVSIAPSRRMRRMEFAPPGRFMNNAG